MHTEWKIKRNASVYKDRDAFIIFFFSVVYVCRINTCIYRLGWNIEVKVEWDLRILKLTNENAFFLPLASIRKKNVLKSLNF